MKLSWDYIVETRAVQGTHKEILDTLLKWNDEGYELVCLETVQLDGRHLWYFVFRRENKGGKGDGTQ